jgi:mRNA-degrading endonuclease RelE of RelBE toxin-antitoxin system
MYEVVISKSANKDMQGLPEEIQDRIIGVLERISVSPHRHARRLSGMDVYRVRVGKCRMVININERLKRIEVLRIGNRENICL